MPTDWVSQFYLCVKNEKDFYLEIGDRKGNVYHGIPNETKTALDVSTRSKESYVEG